MVKKDLVLILMCFMGNKKSKTMFSYMKLRTEKQQSRDRID